MANAPSRKTGTMPNPAPAATSKTAQPRLGAKAPATPAKPSAKHSAGGRKSS